MELDLGFDDADLTIEAKPKRKPEGDLHVPYHVKLCVPEWFEEECCLAQVKDTGTIEDLQYLLKYKADFNYQQKRFSEAVSFYKALFDIIPENNPSLRNDVKESWCRSLMYSGKTNESLKLAETFVSDSLHEDIPHQKQALMLFSAMCEFAEHWLGCINGYEKLCCLQPYYEKFWIRLGHAYLKLIPLLSKIEKNPDLICSEEEYLNLALTSFIKARMLLHHSLFRASNIMKVRNKELLEQTKETIEKLPIEKEQKVFVHDWFRGKYETENVESDPEGGETEVIEEKTNSEVCSDSKSFYNVHCSWISHYTTNKHL